LRREEISSGESCSIASNEPLGTQALESALRLVGFDLELRMDLSIGLADLRYTGEKFA
jgi:hypothetical protein